MKTHGALLLLALALSGCAVSERSGISSYEAMQQYERGVIIVVDVRSASEALGSPPKRPLVHMAFGPDPWGKVSAEHEGAFVGRVRELSDSRPIALLCQYGVRSAAAADALRRHGITALNIADGFFGNAYGPGWKAWE